MNIVTHAPAARGVNQLMYVGDDQAVEASLGMSSRTLVAIAAVGVLFWLFGGRKSMR